MERISDTSPAVHQLCVEIKFNNIHNDKIQSFAQVRLHARCALSRPDVPTIWWRGEREAEEAMKRIEDNIRPAAAAGDKNENENENGINRNFFDPSLASAEYDDALGDGAGPPVPGPAAATSGDSPHGRESDARQPSSDVGSGSDRPSAADPSPASSDRDASSTRSSSLPPFDPPPPPKFDHQYTTEEIVQMQIDGLRHAAVVDEVGSRLDRERWNEEKRGPPPRKAMPADADSKASNRRYTYDRNELDASGRKYVLEEYPAEEMYGHGDEPGAALEDMLPEGVLATCRGRSKGYSCTVLMQGFDWLSSKEPEHGWWRKMKQRVEDIAALGVTHVWLPPPSQSVSPEGYLPGKLWNLDLSAYGTEDELVALNRAFRDAGIVPVCDIVINHRTADEQVSVERGVSERASGVSRFKLSFLFFFSLLFLLRRRCRVASYIFLFSPASSRRHPNYLSRRTR